MAGLKIFYKTLTVLLLFYAIIAGFLMDVPVLPVIGEAIRNLYFHVGMWFAMMMLMLVSLIYSLIYMKKAALKFDLVAREAVNISLVFGVLGIITGMVWARASWGAWWVNDPKLNGAAVAMLAYFAYKVLRGSVKDEVLRARVSAVYNLLAFVIMLIFMMILPRTVGNSIHPGQGGNPALNPAELDAGMRWVFYPALLGWILLGVWLLEIRVRIGRLETGSGL